MRKGFVSIFALCFSLVAGPAVCQSLGARTERAIDVAMQGPVDAGWTAGGAVAVMRAGKVVFARGYGVANLETGTPVTPDTVFRIGSLSKQFTAVAVLLLQQDGKLRLDDPARTYLPQMPAGDPTTIRQLLTHTSGIADYAGREGFDRETLLPHTTDQLLAFVLSKAPLHTFEPGTEWQYSSSNYALAGAIVERVSGMSLGGFLKLRIFDPLGLKSTALDSERDVVPRRASGYDRTPSGYANARAISMTVPFAAGAMRSTVRDLLVWADALSHGRVLQPDSYRQMTTPVRLNDGSLPVVTLPGGGRQVVSYGMGVNVAGDPRRPDLWHDGAIDGFTSRLGVFGASDVAVAILVNTSPSAHLPIAKVIEALQSDARLRPPS